jgi:peroxiredoxin
MISITLSAQPTFKTVNEAQGVAIGARIADFTATDAEGKQFQLSQALKAGTVVLLFYRGQWCPVCSRHLSNLQDSLQYIEQLGARVVAVSPEKQENLQKTVKKTGATFTLLYDKDYQICNAFDVTFLPDGKSRAAYNSMLGASLKTAHSDNSQQLPVPATYIIGQDGTVKWRHFDPNYKVRATPREIIQALEQL